MKTTVIYHRAEFDGIFCREIARKFLPDAELLGWDYGDAHLELPKEGTVYVLDLSPECFWESPLREEWAKRLIWIDHHKTAIEKFSDLIRGYRIDGVAACRLAWHWFTNIGPDNPEGDPVLAKKQDFIDRNVLEPFAVRLAGEYDIWDKRDERAELFQHGLRSQELTEKEWSELLDEKATIGFAHRVQVLLMQGKAVQYARTQENASIIQSCGFTIQFEGFCLLACNAARYNSQLFTAGLKPEHDGMLGFNWDSQQWRVSLYTDKPGIDLSTVAKKYGGGGHKNACGFRAKTLPFIPCLS